MRYRTATKLDQEDGGVQVSTLIYALGGEAENIFGSFHFDVEDDGEDFEVVMDKFDAYFIPKRNVIHERACFYQRVQRAGEKVEIFIRALYELSEHCEFGVNREEHIRDRIVVGIRDKELSRKLQLISNLTLEMTVQEARQQEEVKAQVSQQGEAAACAVEEIARGFSRFKMDERRYNETDQQHRRSERGKTCNRCGKMMHKIQEHCPAIKSTCNKCKKIGHWERMCKSKIVVNEVSEHEENAAYFLGSVKCTPSSSGGQWTVKLNICHTPVSFKIDTGADVCIMSEETFKNLSQVTELHPSKAVLCSPGGRLNCIGQFTANVWHKNKKYSFRVYVVGGESVSNLLSRAAA